MSALVLSEKTLDVAARAAYQARGLYTGVTHPYGMLSEANKKSERDAAFAAISMAIHEGRKETESVLGKGSAYSHTLVKTDVAAKSLSIQDIMAQSVKRIEDRQNIVNYIAYGVSPGIPSGETFNKVGIFLDYLRNIATVTLKENANAESKEEDRDGQKSCC